MALPAATAPGDGRLAEPRLSLGAKVAYGLGDSIVGIRQTAIQFYLLPFYTDVVLVAPWLAGIGKMLGFVWDGLNDPVTGFLSDRTATSIGRRRPFLLAAALPLGLAFGLLWAPPLALGPVTGFVYMVIALAVVDTAFTCFATPYLALGAELSTDYHERTQLSAWRAFFHVLGLFAGGVVPGALLARHAGAPAVGFASMSIGLGVVMAAIALVTGTLVRERSTVGQARPPLSWPAFAHGLGSTLRNPPFRVMLATFAIVLLAGGLHQTIVPYAFRYWLRMPQLVNQVIAVYLGASVVSLPLWTRLARGIGKDRALRVCMVWSVIGLASLPLVLSPEMGPAWLMTFLVVAGLGNGGWAVLPVAITADIVDHDELDTEHRREGAYFGVWTLAMKVANGVASGLVGLGLQASGYVPNQVQAAGTVVGIKLMYGPLPAALMLVALIVFWRFPLTRERHREVQQTLTARRVMRACDPTRMS